jgi:PIN domain nuclease of toxin-antitoxin system
MNYLLDTHAFIWWNENSPKLPTQVRQTLSDRSNQIWLSYASVWELQIKVQIGKLTLGAPLADLIDQEIRVNRLRLLSISYDDILKLDSLPMHHRDPFDRMIIAQTLTGGFHLVACDSEFPAYGVPLLW